MGDVCNVVELSRIWLVVLLLLFSHSLWQGIEISTQIHFENGTKQYIYIDMKTYCVFYEGHLPYLYLCQFTGAVAMTFILFAVAQCTTNWRWPPGESIAAAKPLRMETNKPTPRPRRNSVFPSHQSVGSLRRSAGMGYDGMMRSSKKDGLWVIARIW